MSFACPSIRKTKVTLLCPNSASTEPYFNSLGETFVFADESHTSWQNFLS